MRIDPAPSVPSAAAASPAATAAAEPPLDPPHVRAGSHGLRVAPKASDSVAAIASSSGTCVLPRTTAPAARRRRTTSASSAAGPPWASEPRAVTWPARSVSSLIAIGTPLSGGAPSPRRRSAASARRERLLGEHDAVARDQRVEALDPLQVELRQLARRDLAGADQLGLAREAGEGEVGGVHGGTLAPRPAHAVPPRGGAPRRGCSDAERRARASRCARRPARARARGVGGDALGAAAARPRAGARLRADGAVGGLVAIGAPVAGLAVAAVGALCLASRSPAAPRPLRLLLPQRATQVVLVAPARRRAPVDLLVAARTDVPRGGLARRLAGVRGGLWWLVLAALAVVAACAARASRAPTARCSARRSSCRPSCCSPPSRSRSTRRSAPLGDGARRTRRCRPRSPRTTSSCASRRRASRSGCCSARPDALRAHLPARAARPRAGPRCCTCAPARSAAATGSGAPRRTPPGCPPGAAGRAGCRRPGRRPRRAEPLARALAPTL